MNYHRECAPCAGDVLISYECERVASGGTKHALFTSRSMKWIGENVIT